MIVLSDLEFEKCVKRLIDKEITRTDLAKELRTDTRTLANRIYNIQNQELLKKYLEEFPYKPRQNENINYENLIIEIIKNGRKASDAQEIYDIAERTYRRNIKRVQETNQTLYFAYKNYIHSSLSYDDKEYIEGLEEGPVSFTNSTEDRKAQLIDLFRYYDALIAIGLEVPEALERLGETTKSLKRKSDELERITKEENINKEKNENIITIIKPKDNFVNSLKYEVKNTNTHINNQKKETLSEREI